MAEFEITQSEYITANTTKNQNFADAVEGTYYKKTLADSTTEIPIPAVDDELLEWVEYKTLDWTFHFNPTSSVGVKLKIDKCGDRYRFFICGDNGELYPLHTIYKQNKVNNETYITSHAMPFTYGDYEYPVYAIEARINKVSVANISAIITGFGFSQKTIGCKVSKNGATLSEITDVLPKKGNETKTSWRLHDEILLTGSIGADSPEEFFRTAMAEEMMLFTTPIKIKENNGNKYAEFWSVTAMLGAIVKKESVVAVTTTTSMNADDLGVASFISANRTYYYPFDGQSITKELSVKSVGSYEFDSDITFLEVKHKTYDAKSAKFTLSDNVSPTSKFVLPQTELLTKISYVKREQGNYKQALFAEISDTIINNTKQNRKTTQVEYVGKNNIKVGDTFYYAKDPTTKYIVTKTYLKANPFFVKTIYGRQIL